jgi:hypothetical protein
MYACWAGGMVLAGAAAGGAGAGVLDAVDAALFEHPASSAALTVTLHARNVRNLLMFMCLRYLS